MDFIGLILGKLTVLLGKVLKRGSSLPGYVVMRVSPNILKKIKYPKDIIVVTGTNGKTSTSNLIAEIIKSSGKDVVYNSKGANLLSGLITTIIERTSLGFQLRGDVLLLEIDEATVPIFFKYVIPKYFVINNFFKDQVERHGGVEVVAEKIAKAINKDTILVLNGNDPVLKNLGDNLPENKKIYFGVDRTSESKEKTDEIQDIKICLKCKEELKYNYYHYSHLGDYYSECGFKTPEMNFLAEKVDLNNRTFSIKDEKYKSNYSNLYFIFNSLGAIVVGKELGVEYKDIYNAVEKFELGSGRMENFKIGEYNTFLNLVKNPSGLNQSLSYIEKQEDEKFSIFFAFNNNHSDGIDTSWLWDTFFESLLKTNLDKFICSGDRAYDLAVRLKYSGIESEKIIVESDPEKGVDIARNNKNSKTYFLSSYSALNKVRNKLLSLPENKKEI